MEDSRCEQAQAPCRLQDELRHTPLHLVPTYLPTLSAKLSNVVVSKNAPHRILATAKADAWITMCVMIVGAWPPVLYAENSRFVAPADAKRVTNLGVVVDVTTLFDSVANGCLRVLGGFALSIVGPMKTYGHTYWESAIHERVVAIAIPELPIEL